MEKINNNEELVKVLNGIGKTKIKDALHKAMFKYFGINTNLVAKINGKYVEIRDEGSDVENKMRGNKLLRSVFSSVSLWGQVWMEEETNYIYIDFYLSYTHPSKGSNGIQIGKFIVKPNGKVNFLKY